MRGWGVGGMILPYVPCFTWLLLLYGSIEILIFLKQSSWPKTMYAEHWRKLTSTTLLGSFLIFLVQQFCGALLNSCLLEYPTVFPIKNKFSHLTGYFDFLFWFSSVILLSKMKSLFLNLYTSSLWVTSLLQVPITTGSVY